MAKTLLAIGAWTQCANIVVSATGRGWRVLHTCEFLDTVCPVLQPRIDLVILVTGASAREWECGAQAIRTLYRSAPVLTIDPANSPAVLDDILASHSTQHANRPPYSDNTTMPPKAGGSPYQKSQISPTLTLFESPHLESPSGIDSAMAFIEARYSEAITLADAAKAAFYSRCHFCKLFKEKTGKSFVTALTEVRLRHAAEMLAHSDLSVTDIGFAVGFNDLSHFERVFRSRHNQSPTAFRQSAKHRPHGEHDSRGNAGEYVLSLESI
jgi:AraC-like DNA-binding protein